MQIHIKKGLAALSSQEAYDMLRLRSEVFVVEQCCPYLDMDGKDGDAIHLWIDIKGDMVAYCRILEYEQHIEIGRVVSDKKYRSRGLGKDIFQNALEYCTHNFNNLPILLYAQVYLVDFYSSFGFRVDSKVFLEDGIPHITMVR